MTKYDEIIIEYQLQSVVDTFDKQSAEIMFGKPFDEITEDDIKKEAQERIESGAVFENVRENFEVQNFTVKITKGGA